MAEKTLEEMREAVAAIRETMAAAAREAGRDPAEVQLCAACKTRTAETVAASAALPIDVFGENHVQELCANFDAGAYCGKPSHFIGHLQTNKIKKVLGRASLIQSVDSEHLLAAIEKEAARAGLVQNVLLEVNIGGEASKSGVSPEQLWPLLDTAAAQEHIRVCGLMAIPPVNDDDARNRAYLAAVHKLFVQAEERGYANVKSDAASIEAIGTVFPIVFFVVAILISLTTITRMVEEDRGLIGTYKALGFTDREIRRKYLVYACAASVSGGILGNMCGFVLLPEIIFRIFDTMYLFPDYLLRFAPLLGCGGAALFVAGIVIATACACKAELVHMPAVLMRPKAPRAGSRVLLECITPVWKRLSFLNKVTARNLFRYKKRLFMTVAGIMGCMALLLFGFAVRDSVTDLLPRQYENVYRYDVMAAGAASDNDKILSYVNGSAPSASSSVLAI